MKYMQTLILNVSVFLNDNSLPNDSSLKTNDVFLAFFNSDKLSLFCSGLLTFNALVLTTLLSILLFGMQSKDNKKDDEVADINSKTIIERFPTELKCFFNILIILTFLSIFLSIFGFFSNNNTFAFYYSIVLIIVFVFQLFMLHKIFRTCLDFIFNKRNYDGYTRRK